MGKKKVAFLGTENEDQVRAKKTVKLQQKKLREGKALIKEEVEPVVTPVQEVTPMPEVKTKRVHQRSKQYGVRKQAVDVTKSYALSEALKLLRQVSDVKFDPTVELHINLKEKGLNKEVELPHATGKIKRIAVADETTITKIEAGKLDFDVLIASPEQMGKLVKFAKVLGPKGLMPNPKNGTVVPDPAKTVAAMAKKNAANLRSEKDAPLVHTMVGKLSLTDKQLADNIQAILAVLSGQTTKIVLKSTMSPAIKLQI